jgi:hypothetical protein
MSQSNLTKAFKELRMHGYFARQNFTCCQSCGWAEVPEDKGDKAVFYHNQDYQSMKEGGDLYLAWSGDGNLICNVLRENGMEVRWDGTSATRICVTSGF